ncbi:MAG: TIGR03986 family CRISPR-associated RAMP protein [Pseudomonadota bacterium]
MTTAFAPYGFVPLNEEVYLPDWAPAVSRDWPFEDGISGTMEIDITAHTPIFTRDPEDRERFFRGPDGLPAFPGSGLRGAIRSVVEIASFGWMRRVNDHRYGVRDLQNAALYVRHMADIMPALNGKNLPLPKVMAGWLQVVPGADLLDGEPGEDVATITPCSFAKMDYRLLMEHARKSGLSRYQPGEPQSSASKYRTWNAEDSTDPRLQVKVDIEPLRPPDKVPLPVGFGAVTGPGHHAGTLVFTGQPSRWTPDMAPRRSGGHAKHHDFVFYGERPDKSVSVPRSVFDGFEFVHGGGQEQHSLNQRRSANEEWGFWQPKFEQRARVPVFFLLKEDGSLRAFGLAMMFRLAYDHTTRDAVRSAQRDLGVDPRPDLAELVFGHVPLARKGRGADRADREATLAGRVSFGLGRLRSGGNALPRVQEVLGGPKASFYPSYVEQDPGVPGANPIGGKDHYATYMDPDARVRGHKRYRMQPEVVKGPEPPKRRDGTVNTDVATTFHPLEVGSVFRSVVRVHNLRPVELGALLWALDFGGDDGCYHGLGMARSLGYGRCSITIAGTDLVPNDPARRGSDLLEEARRAFAGAMESFCEESRVPGGWLASRRIFELRELARVLPADSPHRRAMSIAASRPYQDRKVNEFVEAKKEGLSLPPAGTDAGWVGYAAEHGKQVERPRRCGATSTAPNREERGGRAGGAPAQGGRGGYRDPGGRVAPAPIPAAPRHTGWKPIPGGTEVQAEIVGQNKKGKWQVRLTGPEAQGQAVTATVGIGDPPTDAAVGKTVTVVVHAGGDPRNLGLQWR